MSSVTEASTSALGKQGEETIFVAPNSQFAFHSRPRSKNPSQRGFRLSDSAKVDVAAGHWAASGKNSSMFLYPLLR